MVDVVTYVTQYTPWGEMVFAANARGLVAMRFTDQGVPDHWQAASRNQASTSEVLAQAAAWLKRFASDPTQCQNAPHLDEASATPFQRKVWRLLDRIPSGTTTSYSDLAKQLDSSPRAVGRAVGSNPWLLLRPCHRVVGANGQLTGYAGGLPRKQALLQHEGV
ncbi:MAG: hypothetical protein RL307_806 [Pseudomonadota bacterium]|jgi:methylated-DNA-[protein]-cysteine S-methyltransferase